MKSFLVILSVILSLSSWANERPITYRNLIGIQETLSLRGITLQGVVDVTKTDAWGIVMNPTAIKLTVHGVSACGQNIMVMNQNSVIRFYQVGPLGPHIQPGCHDAIEYYLVPYVGDTKVGETVSTTTYFGGSFYSQPNLLYAVTVKATHQFGNYGKGNGHYYTYSDVTVQQISK